jgi:hypothetical protein
MCTKKAIPQQYCEGRQCATGRQKKTAAKLRLFSFNYAVSAASIFYGVADMMRIEYLPWVVDLVRPKRDRLVVLVLYTTQS